MRRGFFGINNEEVKVSDLLEVISKHHEEEKFRLANKKTFFFERAFFYDLDEDLIELGHMITEALRLYLPKIDPNKIFSKEEEFVDAFHQGIRLIDPTNAEKLICKANKNMKLVFDYGGLWGLKENSKNHHAIAKETLDKLEKEEKYLGKHKYHKAISILLKKLPFDPIEEYVVESAYIKGIKKRAFLTDGNSNKKR